MGEQSGSLTGGGRSVLVVEDEALVLMSLADMLEELGYSTLQATNAEAALAILESAEPIDILLSDINLPDMKGQELAHRARAVRPRLPVVFSTGYRIDVPDDLVQSGPTAMLGKPFWIPELEKALAQVS